MPYDQLIDGGHLLDLGQGKDGVLDIAGSGKEIAAVEPILETPEALYPWAWHWPETR